MGEKTKEKKLLYWGSYFCNIGCSSYVFISYFFPFSDILRSL